VVQRFAYQDPDSVPAVLSILATHGSDARLLAGGQSLIVLLRQRLLFPEVVVGLEKVALLREVSLLEGGTLRIGAMVTYREAAASGPLRQTAALVARASGLVGSMHIRERGTIGGSVCHADPAGDVPVALMAHDACYEWQDQDGRHLDRASGFATGLFETRLPADALLTGVLVPPQPPGARLGYARFLLREGEYPMTQCAVRVELDGGLVNGARIAVGGGGDHPRRLEDVEHWLIGTSPDRKVMAGLQEQVSAAVRPYPDVRGSTEWKAHVVGVVARRAMEDAVTR
jgi:carbon-monoxide dehydrogenase medium subunit